MQAPRFAVSQVSKAKALGGLTMAYEQKINHVVSLQEHPDFLSLLQNETFRQELQARPVEVLGQCNISMGADDIPDSVHISEVPGDLEVADRFVEEIWATLL